MAYLTSDILLKRLTKYTIDCQKLTLLLPKMEYNVIYSKQLIRSSSSPAANYIEAIEASTSKEFTHKLKICRKEAKESIYWVELIKETNGKNSVVVTRCMRLISEGTEPIKIFASSIITSERNQKIKNRK
jgi:four helix bundle protein